MAGKSTFDVDASMKRDIQFFRATTGGRPRITGASRNRCRISGKRAALTWSVGAITVNDSVQSFANKSEMPRAICANVSSSASVMNWLHISIRIRYERFLVLLVLV